MTEQVEEKVRARRWVLVWAKDEKFWKDVAANTVAGIILAIILYVFAVVMGYIQNPGLWESIGAFLTSVVFTSGFGGLLGLLGVVLSFFVHKFTGPPKKDLRPPNQRWREDQRG